MYKEGYVLECRGLSKKYKDLYALNHVDLQLERGKIIGLVGPNGSGKTTLIKLMNGLLVPTEGEILYNGTYALTSKSERLSDLVKKAGNVTPYAYVRGSKLMRKANDEELKRMEDVLKLMQREMGSLADSLKLELDSIYPVAIDLEKALKNPGGVADIVLREGDQLITPEYTNTVKINGAVMMPNTVTYTKGLTVKDYISQAGGFANGAKKSKAFIIIQ